MLSIHTSERGPTGRLGIAVDHGEDSPHVDLVVEVDPRDLIRTHSRPAPGVDDLVAQARPGTRRYLLATEILRLREQLDSRVTEIERRIEPHEARSVAAALVHVAGEIEAGR